MDIYEQLRQEITNLKKRRPELFYRPGYPVHIDADGFIASSERFENVPIGIVTAVNEVAVSGTFTTGRGFNKVYTVRIG